MEEFNNLVQRLEKEGFTFIANWPEMDNEAARIELMKRFKLGQKDVRFETPYNPITGEPLDKNFYVGVYFKYD